MFLIYRIAIAFHLIAVISWMAAILYLYRLFIYHTEETEKVVKARFEVMEKRLARIILLPAALIAILLGLWLLYWRHDLLRHPWMRVKLVFVLGLMVMTHFAGNIRRSLAAGRKPFRPTTLRILNEVPTLLMIVIVYMVIVRPWS